MTSFWRSNLEDSEKLSLYRFIADGGYEASVLATYAISFPFYERVVLRKLQAAGCRHNILLADGGQCAKQLESVETTPHFCGSDYLLLPIATAASFHPKFVLLLGKRGAHLILGSHNVTIAGFGLNRESATALVCTPEGAMAAAAQHVWQFVRAWTAGFPVKIREVIAATERMAPWIVAQGETPASPVVWGSQPFGPSLWGRVKPLLGQRVNRVTIVSPYFDAKLAFVNLLEKELQPKECIVAVHPMFSDLPANARTLSPRTRFVDVSGLGDGWAERYLHAKLYRFELASGKSVVVVGSANASAPAWLADGTGRNAELVVVHQDAQRLWKRLGLSEITAAPEVGKEGWAELKARAETRKEQRVLPSPFLAVATPNGFIVDEAFVKGIKADAIQVVVEETATAAIQTIRHESEGALCVCTAEAIRSAATRLEATPAAGRKRVALIHHVSELLDKAAGNIRQAFRFAFSGLEGDPEQLTELMKVVEKAIFDEHISLNLPEGASRTKPGKGAKPEASTDPETLAISAKDTTRARRRRRLSASSDLAMIIDALIYRLGQGLFTKPEPDSLTSVAPSEETLRNEETEPPEIDGHILAKACRGKVNRLFRRMIAQCEAAVARGTDATTPIIQLAAVLGVVRHLRVRQATFGWLPKGEQLVDPDKEWDFFKDASRCLYAPACGLAAKALPENDGGEFDELTTVRGLLTWLALDCELDTRHVLVDQPDIVRDNLVGVAYLLPVITECAKDDLAEAVLSEAAGEQKDSMRECTSYHIHWARGVAKAFRDHQLAAGSIAIGDLVSPSKMSASWPLIVVDAQYSKTGVVNLDTGEPKYYGAGFMVRLQSLTGIAERSSVRS